MDADGFSGLLLLLLVEAEGFHLVELLEEVSGFFSGFCWDFFVEGWFVTAGFFVEPFPVMGVNGMRKCLHFGEVCWFTLLIHNIFDLFGQSGIVLVLENIVAPTY